VQSSIELAHTHFSRTFGSNRQPAPLTNFRWYASSPDNTTHDQVCLKYWLKSVKGAVTQNSPNVSSQMVTNTKEAKKKARNKTFKN